MTTSREKLPEIDLLRTLAIIIVVLMIHIPNNYAYNFYIELDRFSGFFLHTLGIDVALGSFTFLSGFGLYLQKTNRNINTFEKLSYFLKKRILRIFPLYWIALALFLIFFSDFYGGMNIVFLLFHIVGLQMMVAPSYGSPIWTLWFIGIIVIYYLIFILLSYLGTIKKIIPASLVILIFFLILHFNFNLVEYRFFVYYPPFILGIIVANIYTSPHYLRIKEYLTNIHLLIQPITILCCTIIGWFLYTNLAKFCYSEFLSNFGTTILPIILDQQVSFLEFSGAIILIDLIIVAFICFILAFFHLLVKIFTLFINRNYITKAISLVAFSTYAVYLFHRPFLITFDFIMLEVFNIDMLEKSNFYLILLSLPTLFILAYFIQKTSDIGISRINSRLREIRNNFRPENNTQTEK
ncbi:MAG: acyltransferase family protein [Candidatus Hodarchaeales archaeon]